MRWVRSFSLLHLLSVGVLAMFLASFAIAKPMITANSTRPIQVQSVKTLSEVNLTKDKQKKQNRQADKTQENKGNKTKDAYLKAYLQQHPISAAQKQQIEQKAQTELHALQHINVATLNAAIQAPNTIKLPIYPIQSKKLSVGTIKKQSVNLSLSKPIFLVGCDPASQEWLKQNIVKLKQLHAMGFIVNAPSREAATALQKSALMLPLVPMQGDALADWLHLNHYPVLILPHSIEQ